MYCSIQEAWADHNFINDIHNTSNRESYTNISKPQTSNRDMFMDNNMGSILNKSDKRPEFFNNYSQQPNTNNYQLANHQMSKHQMSNNQITNHLPTNTEIVEKYNHSAYNCHNFIEHLENCSECQSLISNKYKTNSLTELFKTNPQLKETIVVFLLGLLIIMILNLLYK